jgi:MoaA/NifB/PqqE/SkfB family radical SAM enzyme
MTKSLKAYLNVGRLRLNMALHKPVLSNYPIVAYIEPTSLCNLRCPACPTGLQLKLRPLDMIDVKLFEQAIDDIGDYLFHLIMYNWGEPLLHKQTPEMVKYAKAKGISITMSTNLSIKLDDEYIERLVLSGLDNLIVSLDGVTPETYEKYRRRGTFDLVISNMKRIQEAKRRLGVQTPLINWQFLVFQHNEHEIEQANALYKQWGADMITYVGAIMPYDKYNDGFASSTIPQYNIYHPDNPRTHKKAAALKSKRSCTWLHGVFVMNPNGSVSPCCGAAAQKDDFSEYKLGSNFMDMWNSPRFRRARAMFNAQMRNQDTTGEIQAVGKYDLKNASPVGDGMAIETTFNLNNQDLICHNCPMPEKQDYLDPYIQTASTNAIAEFLHEKHPRHLAAYLLMGMPYLRECFNLARTVVTYKWKLITGQNPAQAAAN